MCLSKTCSCHQPLLKCYLSLASHLLPGLKADMIPPLSDASVASVLDPDQAGQGFQEVFDLTGVIFRGAATGIG